jgi:hypothetical protein
MYARRLIPAQVAAALALMVGPALAAGRTCDEAKALAGLFLP